MRALNVTPRMLLPAAAATVSILLMCWPAPFHLLDVPGHPLGEADNHLWMLWVAAQRLMGHPGPWFNLPEGLPIPLMDQVNLLFFLPLAELDPALAFNAVVVGDLAIAFAGAWWLARELGVSRQAAITAGVAACTAPFLAGAMAFGITESLPVGWIGLHAAAVLRWGRTGRPRWILVSGLLLAAFAASGWYHAAFGLLVEAVLLPWVWHRHGRAGGLLLQGGLALALTLPRFLTFLDRTWIWSERWRSVAPFPQVYDPGWRHPLFGGSDLLNLLLPAVHTTPISRTVYLGVVVLALALAAGRRALLPWALALPLLVLSLGNWLVVGGHGRLLGHAWLLPAGALSREIPWLRGISHWYRAAGPATVFLAAAAAMGAERLSRRRAGLLALAPVLVVADSLAFGQTPWPRPHYDPRPPSIYGELRGPGAIVQLPFDNGRIPFSDEVPRIYNRWQPFLGRPVAENYEGPDAMLFESPLVASADALCGVHPTVPATWRSPAELERPWRTWDPATLARELGRLREWGVGWVALHRRRALTPGRASSFLRHAFGDPVLSGDGIEFYAVGSPAGSTTDG